MSNSILVEEIAGSMVVRFNRPKIRSPLSVEILEKLRMIVDEAAGPSSIDRIVFTGVDDVFASGADLREIAQVDGSTATEFARRGQDLMQRISDLPVQSIAAVNGVCFGGALDLALACSIRIASENSLFAHPGADLGIMTGWGGTQRLPRLIGQARALEIFFTTKRVDAREALAIGLIDRIAADPLDAALALN